MNKTTIILNALVSLKDEPRIIKDAVAGNSLDYLDETYWRVAVLRPVFGDPEDFPNALKSHFCPLFWVSNFFPVLWVWIGIVSVFCLIQDKILTANKKRRDAKRKISLEKESKSQKEKFEIWKSRIYEVRPSDVFQYDEEELENYLQRVEADNSEDFTWDSPSEMSLKNFYNYFENHWVNINSNSAVGARGVIFGLKKLYGDDWKAKAEEISKNYTEELQRIEQEKELKKLRSKNKYIIDLVKRSKSFFKWSFVVGIVVSIVLAFKTIAWAFWGVMAGIKFAATGVWSILLFAWANILWVLAFIVFLFVLSLIFHGLCALKEKIAPNRGYIKEKVDSVLIVIVYPIFLIIKGIFFIKDLAAMFYNENCPAIKINKKK